MGLLGGLLKIGGSLLGLSSSNKGADQAAQAQLKAAELGIAEQRRQYDQTRGDLSPWMTAGQDALGGQSDILGLNGGDAQAASIAALKASPLYQSLFRTGEEAVLQNTSATGGLRGGNAQRSLYELGEDTLTRVIENQLTRLGGVSGQGQNAAAGIGVAGSNSADAIGRLLGDQGAASAGAALAKGANGAAAINAMISGASDVLPSISKDFGKLF